MSIPFSAARRHLRAFSMLLLWIPIVGICAPNTIQRENQKVGTSMWQLVAPSATPAVEGYASSTSVNRGESISFFVSSSAPSYVMTIYRVGWYGGLGARQVWPLAG